LIIGHLKKLISFHKIKNINYAKIKTKKNQKKVNVRNKNVEDSKNKKKAKIDFVDNILKKSKKTEN
jgi:hypothetical protein